MNDDPEIQRAVRRTVGIATLRRLQRMVADENAEAARNAVRIRRLSLFFAAATLLTVLWMVFR